MAPDAIWHIDTPLPVETHYDDSGISGGILERRLLLDIHAGRVHVVVGYKVAGRSGYRLLLAAK